MVFIFSCRKKALASNALRFHSLRAHFVTHDIAMTRETRTLTVLFADITESSRLYQQLGNTDARTTIAACLASLVDLLPQFEGRLVKTLGDAIMCAFPNATSAVKAAIEMQALVTNQNWDGPPIRLHIGLHAGSVVVEEGDIFGDTVNAAAFLANAAMAEQILLSAGTEKDLSLSLKPLLQPLFRAVLKGTTSESAIYQVNWRVNNLNTTNVNLQVPRLLPGDAGSLVVILGEARRRIDRWHPHLIIGRDSTSDLEVPDEFASRRHCSIRLVRFQFYLIDHSVNGTYVIFSNGDEIHLLRNEVLLEGSGELRPGRGRADSTNEPVLFKRDQRSQFRP